MKPERTRLRFCAPSFYCFRTDTSAYFPIHLSSARVLMHPTVMTPEERTLLSSLLTLSEEICRQVPYRELAACKTAVELLVLAERYVFPHTEPCGPN